MCTTPSAGTCRIASYHSEAAGPRFLPTCMLCIPPSWRQPVCGESRTSLAAPLEVRLPSGCSRAYRCAQRPLFHRASTDAHTSTARLASWMHTGCQQQSAVDQSLMKPSGRAECVRRNQHAPRHASHWRSQRRGQRALRSSWQIPPTLVGPPSNFLSTLLAANISRSHGSVRRRQR